MIGEDSLEHIFIQGGLCYGKNQDYKPKKPKKKPGRKTVFFQALCRLLCGDSRLWPGGGFPLIVFMKAPFTANLSRRLRVPPKSTVYLISHLRPVRDNWGWKPLFLRLFSGCSIYVPEKWCRHQDNAPVHCIFLWWTQQLSSFPVLQGQGFA